ncbi:hypothetical protein Tco_1561816 [Tanacetum coccineum]
MANLKFAKTHNLVAYLEKPEESDGFKVIIDFLNASSIRYALTIQALVDGKKVIVNETSVRRALQLKDAECTECLPNATIFVELERMGYENLTQKLTFYKAFFSPQWKFLIHTILQCLSAKTTAWNEFSSTMASAIICLVTNQKFNFSKYIFDNMVKNLEGRVKFLMYPREGKGFSGRVTPLFQTMMVQAPEELGEGSEIPTDPQHIPTINQLSSSQPLKKQKPRKTKKQNTEVSQPSDPTQPMANETEDVEILDLENTKTSQAAEIAKLKEKVKKLERRSKSRTSGLKRLRKVGRTARIESSEDEGLGAQEDASKQGRKITDLDADAEVTLVNEARQRNDDNLMFDTGVFDEQEVEVEKVVSNAEVTTASTTTTTVDELTLAQTLIEIKAAKPKAVTTTTTAVTRPKARRVVVQEPSEFRTTTSSSQTSQLPQAKEKGKEKMIEPEKPLKKKDQILVDEEIAQRLQEEL